tara:strand:+ start:1669 stop:3501 length:1833 start_codon:yes stop_codon:yes gene_type:complete
LSLYELVPKTLKENLEWRMKLLEWANTPERQRTLWTACKHDILFFINSFCWLYEPRGSRLVGTTSNVIPFITYEFQDDAFLRVENALGDRDIVVNKSRDLGASWMFLTTFFYHWMFNDFSLFGVMSRTADLVDKVGKRDTLFWKLDFLLKGDAGMGGLPNWMQPKTYRSNMLMENRDNGASICGATTTEDSWRGSRCMAIGIDELASFPVNDGYKVMAAAQMATDSMYIVSTPKGTANSYYDIVHTPSDMEKITLDWKQHPDRRHGLYTSKNGKLEILDTEYEFPEDYQFILDGKVRAPYYDRECNRPGATSYSIAQELDRSFGGSDYQIFGSNLYEVGQKGVLRPFSTGFLYYDEETLEPEFNETEKGPFALWGHRDSTNRPVKTGNYVVGCDIASGLGGSYSSNSVMVVIDTVTGSQVAEFATNTLRPEAFADLVIAACKWFNNAYLIFELNGSPGGSFKMQLLERCYGNIYYRTVENKSYKKKTQNPGWFSTDKNKLAVLSQMSAAVESGEFVIRSESLLDECREYVYQNGKVVHSKSVNTKDDSAKGQAHGDRVIAAALAWHAAKDRPMAKPVEVGAFEEDLPYGSMAWRIKLHEDRIAFHNNDGW